MKNFKSGSLYLNKFVHESYIKYWYLNMKKIKLTEIWFVHLNKLLLFVFYHSILMKKILELKIKKIMAWKKISKLINMNSTSKILKILWHSISNVLSNKKNSLSINPVNMLWIYMWRYFFKLNIRSFNSSLWLVVQLVLLVESLLDIFVVL